MSNLLKECNSGDMETDERTFQQTWCVRCSLRSCSLAGFAKDDMLAVRNATWRDRFFNAEQADLHIPKFALISKTDFPNLLQKAMKLEISERRGDWSVPDVSHVIPDSPATATPKAVDTDKPPPGIFDDEEESPVENEDVVYEGEALDYERPRTPLVEETPKEAPMQAPAPTHPKSQKAFQPRMRNVPDQGGVMLGGAPAPKEQATPASEVDPWAPPTRPQEVIVKSGAHIQFGSGGQGKVVDD